MIKFKKKLIEEEVIDVIICDCCKKEIKAGKPKDWYEMEEMWNISRVGGFGSIFGDCVPFKLDICQHCVKKLLGKYIQFEEEEE